MKTKRIKITIGDKYVEIDLAFDDDEIDDTDEELIAHYGFLGAYAAGEIQIDIQDIDNAEYPETKLQ